MNRFAVLGRSGMTLGMRESCPNAYINPPFSFPSVTLARSQRSPAALRRGGGVRDVTRCARAANSRALSTPSQARSALVQRRVRRSLRNSGSGSSVPGPEVELLPSSHARRAAAGGARQVYSHRPLGAAERVSASNGALRGAALCSRRKSQPSSGASPCPSPSWCVACAHAPYSIRLIRACETAGWSGSFCLPNRS